MNDKILTGDIDMHIVKTILKTNYYGTLAIMTEFLPLIRSGGRLVNVASSDGQLIPYSESLKQAFIDASKTSVEACTVLMEKFTADVLAKREKLEGWPNVAYAYAVSKAGEIASTKAIAMEAEKSGGKVLINACCPGFVNTDMTQGNGILSVLWVDLEELRADSGRKGVLLNGVQVRASKIANRLMYLTLHPILIARGRILLGI
jgi:carbonyl reductase 1